MTRRKAIVTLAIGGHYRAHWDAVCRPNWQVYADRHGYDLICLDRPLDTSERAARRSPAWQKCLVLSQDFSARYERIVWMDTDVLINPFAPDLAADVPPDHVGGVDEYSVPTTARYRIALRKLYDHWRRAGVGFRDNLDPQDVYTTWGLPAGFDRVMLTGLMVLSPRHHRDVLETAYREYDDKGPGWNYEMRPLSYELLRRARVHWLDGRFNYVWDTYKAIHFPFLLEDPAHPRGPACLNTAFADVHCLHFSSSMQDMPLVDWGHVAPRASAGTPAHAERSFGRALAPVVLIAGPQPPDASGCVAALRDAQPKRMFFVGGDSQAQDDIAAEIDWPCDLMVITPRLDDAASSSVEERALDQVFELVDRAVIMHADTLVEPAFFAFCDELLERYADDERVMAISGSSFQCDRVGPFSYHGSRYTHMYGWATWRRAWKCYRSTATASAPLARDEAWRRMPVDGFAARYWRDVFDRARSHPARWEYRWIEACWARDAITLVPGENLVSTRAAIDDPLGRDAPRLTFSDLPTAPIAFPLRHPPAPVRHAAADAFTEEFLYSGTVRRLLAAFRARRQQLTHDRQTPRLDLDRAQS